MKKVRLLFELIFIFIVPFFYIISNITFKYSSVDSEKIENIEFTDDIFLNDSEGDSPILELFKVFAKPLKLNTNSEMFKIFTSYTCLWFLNLVTWNVFYRLFNGLFKAFKKDDD